MYGYTCTLDKDLVGRGHIPVCVCQVSVKFLFFTEINHVKPVAVNETLK